MKDKARRMEVRTVDGKVILVLYLYEEIALEDQPKAKESPKPDAGQAKPQNSSPSKENPPMTDAQKRYLFRIMAEKGYENDQGYAKLKELFQVDSLKEVTKLEASRMIERLLDEAKGESHDAIPF
ncbi:MAG: hypothetical protein NTW38_01645 [Candidatus Aminicenantes bacterium]|nr:hypothetical protein [Candidatus Aminicenantes bacterium]